MSFNPEQTEKDMLASAQAVMGTEWLKIKDALQQVIDGEREALKKIAEAYALGKVKVPRSRAAGHLALEPKDTSKQEANPDYVRMSFSSQQQSCWVFQDAFINEDDLKSQLEDEKKTFNAGLSMVHAVKRASVQNAVNAALGTFWKAVSAAVKPG